MTSSCSMRSRATTCGRSSASYSDRSRIASASKRSNSRSRKRPWSSSSSAASTPRSALDRSSVPSKSSSKTPSPNSSSRDSSQPVPAFRSRGGTIASSLRRRPRPKPLHLRNPASLAASVALALMLGAVSPVTAQTPSPADTSAASSPPASETAAPPADTSSAPPASETAADSVAAPTESARIGDISVEGNARTESSRIVRSFEVPTGSHYSKDALRRGIRKLFALGLFEDVWLEEMPHGQTVDVLIHVRERPRLGTLDFNGNKKREDSELEKKMTLHVGDIVTPT